MKKIIFCLFIFLIQNSLAQGISAKRLPNESVKEAYLRSLPLREEHESYEYTPYTARKPIASGVDVTLFKPWTADESPEIAFNYIRDLKFLKHNDLYRRLSWLYPDDGCYLRAELAAKKLLENSYPQASKLYVFGRLKVLTDNSTEGYVTWWYHVVPAYNFNGQIIVLDPSVSSKKYLLLQDFIDIINANKEDMNSIEYAVCENNTLTPHENCAQANAYDEEEISYHEKAFLDLEWERLEELGRSPNDELGDMPPWLRSIFTKLRPSRAQ